MRRILRQLGDGFQGDLTANSTSNSVLQDRINFHAGVEGVIGRQFLVLTGADQGHIGNVLRYNPSGGTVEYFPFTAFNLTAGTRIQWSNKRGRGFLIETVREVINDVISDSSPRFMDRSTTAPLDYSLGDTIVLGADVKAVESVQVFDGANWHDLDVSGSGGGNGWWLDDEARTLTLVGPMAAFASGRQVRLLVMTPPQLFTDDFAVPAEETNIPAEWLVRAAMAQLNQHGIDRDPTRYTLYREDEAAAERLKVIASTRQRSSARIVRN